MWKEKYQELDYRRPEFNTKFEIRMKRLRLSHALGISYNDVVKLFLNRNDIICKRMKAKLTKTRKQYELTSNLTKDSFMHLMFDDEDFEVINWGVQVKIAGEVEKGWNFQIEGNHLYYANRSRTNK